MAQELTDTSDGCKAPRGDRFYRERDPIWSEAASDASEGWSAAVQLARTLHKVHYGPITSWRPLPTVAGVISQIDNMTAGLGKMDRTAEPNKLPECPFCGEGEALSLHSSGHHHIECQICFAQGPASDKPEVAIEAWGIRHEVVVLREALELMVNAFQGEHQTYRKTAMIRAREALAMR